MPDEPSLLPGAQRPRICHVPDYVSTAGDEAVELAAMAGLELDDWQQFVLRHALGERPDGNWAAQTVGLVCPRQNGKNAILEARELWGLFLGGEQTIIHSAHEQATSSEQFRRLQTLIESVPEFDRRVSKVIKGKGSEAIELDSGQRILFKTRTGGGARGFSIDCVVFDEAYELPETAISAIVPALSARPNTQRWYTSSAVDQDKHTYGTALARQRERGIGRKPGVAYFEWSIEGDDPGRVPAQIRTDPGVWAQANPSLGDRISYETVQHECDGEMGAREFAVERLGIGDWPDTSEDAGRVISSTAWLACAERDPSNRVTGVPTFAADGNMDGTWASIAVCGARADEVPQGAVVRHERGTDWIVPACSEIQGQHRKSRFVIDKRGPLAHLIPKLKAARVRLIEASTEDYGNACADFVAAVVGDRDRPGGQFRYPHPQPELDEALANARKAPLGDRWKWSRKDSAGADISSLVAVTLAYWGATQARPKARVINLNDL